MFYQRSWRRHLKAASLLRSHKDSLILVDAHPRRPQVGRVAARHAHTCHAPSGSAAGASGFHSDRRVRLPLGQTPPSQWRLSTSLSGSLTASESHSGQVAAGGNGECIFAASAAPVPANPLPTSSPANRTHYPPLTRDRYAAAASAGRGLRLRWLTVTASGAAAPGGLCASIPPDFSGPVTVLSVYSPLHPSDFALCSACYLARPANSRAESSDRRD